MSLAALLLLAALAPVPPGGEGPRGGRPDAGPATEARVASLTLVPDGDDEARRLVLASGLTPGAPLAAESVRHAVELLFATRRYADVRVTAVEGPAGSDLTVTLEPAPLLVGLRIEGRRLLTETRARELARLRLGEALWPARLERAARDLALHLAGQGYLEARVSGRAEMVSGQGSRPQPGADTRLEPPNGARAVFQIVPGRLTRVGQLAVRDAGGGRSTEALAGQAGPKVGQPFRREASQKAAGRMRRRLLELGFWQATVEVNETYDPSAARVNLEFVVRKGPFVQVEFRGAPPPPGLRRSIERRLREAAASTDALEQGAESLENELRRQGRREARVTARQEPGPSRLALVYEIEAGPQATVARVEVRGLESLPEAPALPPLLTQPGQPLQDALVDQDARSLQDALVAAGYGSARVEPELPDGGGNVAVVQRARPGPRTLVSEVGLTLASPASLSVPPPPLRLVTGQPYREGDVALDRAGLLAAYRNSGYQAVEVEARVEPAEAGPRVRFEVRPGPRSEIADVVVAGLADTRESVVRRSLGLERGGPLSPHALLDAQRRLAGLGLFGRVAVRELDPDAGPQRSVLVEVEEARRTVLSYGLGYSELEGARGSVEWTRRNLFGLDRTLTVFGRYGTRGNRAFVSYREPWLLGRSQELFLTGFREEENRESFSFIRFGGLVQTVRPLAARTSLILRLTHQNTQLFRVEVPLDEIERQYQSTITFGPSVTLIFDSRDDPLEPRQGRFVSADLQLSLPGLGGTRFVKGFVQSAAFRGLGPRALLALGARLGLSATYGEAAQRLPLADRYFAGGDYSVRGFRTDYVGPLEIGSSGELVPTGGNALLIGNAELRFNLARGVTLATFLDTGNVYPLASDLTLSDLRASAGLGLRYRSPVGPLRLDWGYKLDRRPGESPSHLHVTIGHAF